MGCRTLTMEVHNLSADGNCALNNQEQPQPCAREKLDEMIAGDSLDYNSWKSLISEIETASPDDIDTISVAYDYFLSKFPLCHWYWEKYAYHKVKLCGAPEAVKIFERGVKAVECSVGFWVDYFKFGTSFFGDPYDVRRLFGRGLSCVGKDYFCHVLWDGYLKYEFNQEGWSFLAQSYIEALKFPTKKLHFYYDNFKKFVSNLEEEMGYENSWSIEVGSVSTGASKINKDEISLVIKDLLDSSDRSIKFKALDRYKSIGNRFYQEARLLDEEIKSFETNIRRRYFHVTPLDDDELTNWHHYLDFIEKQEDMDWAVKLYERCLISCANYPEFWIRYVEFLESKRGYQLAISVLDRATQIFLKNVPEIHFFNARFKEQIGDADGARAALLLCDAKTDSNFIESVIKQANMEKRLGNLAAASATYEKGLKIASDKQKLHILPTLYFHFARLTFMITSSADAARDVIIRGIRHVPHCRYLLEELIKFAMMHEGASQVNIVESIIADAISPGSDKSEGLNAKDREDISYLYIESFSLTGLGLDHASKSQSSAHLIKLAEKEQVPVLAVNNDVQPSLVLEEKSMQMDDDNNTKEKLQRLSPEVTVVSKEYASQGP
ncbi:Tetratricopeptide repeat (TPR)-like superfamily protein [Forsythia ovata]|uniref:Tetratricopeptide repeat (TPR)-like superfamily protein n=1 Tax=Forsythia ovata TaxID=205694 RepID=A0ABD1S1L0_9LAMI